MTAPASIHELADTPASEWIRAGKEKDFELPLPDPDGKPSRTLKMRFRRVPAGSFRMGSRGNSEREEPVHRVQVDGFWLGRFVVTQEEWTAVARHVDWPEERGRDFVNPSNFKGARLPVEEVSWDDVQLWLKNWDRWLASRRRRTGDPCHVRMPTEAEWEYACRAGTVTEYWFGDGAEALASVGWFDANSGNRTHPVDDHPTPAGRDHPLHIEGLHGNVDEWCSDVYDPMAYQKRPDGWKSRSWTRNDAGLDATHFGESVNGDEAPVRVFRGGSWIYSALRCRATLRRRRWPNERNVLQGFRVYLVRGPAALQRESQPPTEICPLRAEKAGGGAVGGLIHA